MGENCNSSSTIHFYRKIFMHIFKKLVNKKIVKYNDSMYDKMAYNFKKE